MSVMTENIALVEGAKAHVREVAVAMATVGLDPIFDIQYKGFGTGGTAGVSATRALRFLSTLAETQGMHDRYRTRIQHITIVFRTPPKTFAA